MNKYLVLLIVALTTGWPTAVTAASIRQESAPSSPSLWPVVLAMFALAFAVERIVELLWDVLEWLLLNLGRWRAARLKTASYLQFKGGASILLACTLGVLVASVLNLHLFAALQLIVPGFAIAVPANWDVVLTGLIIGATAKPVHDLIGLLAELKSFMGNASLRQREAAGAALADGVLKLAQSEQENMIEVPGMGPTSLTINGRYGETAAPVADKSATDRYIEILHDRTMM
jgi:hypothetical protein